MDGWMDGWMDGLLAVRTPLCNLERPSVRPFLFLVIPQRATLTPPRIGIYSNDGE